MEQKFRVVLSYLDSVTAVVKNPYPKNTKEIKETLPIPILEDNPQYVKLYWKAWEIAQSHIDKGTRKNGFIPFYMDEAYNERIFYWDTAFMVMFAKYALNKWPGIISLDNFYQMQHENGFISRELYESDGSDFHTETAEQASNPPLFSWAEWDYYQVSGDKSRFLTKIKSKKDKKDRTILDRLILYYGWLEKNREEKDGLYKNTKLGCGMDNTPREGDYWIDMTAQMALNALCVSKIAGALDDKETEAKFLKKYKAIKKAINDELWDKKDSFYYDKFEDGKFHKVKTIASYWPLIAEVPEKSMMKSLIKYLKDPDHFWRKNVFPTLSASDKDYKSDGEYWRGSVWAPTNYMVIKGLQNYGYEKEATEASQIYLDNMSEVLDDTDTIWENYAPDKTHRGKRSLPEFVGWSGIGPISLLIENVIGIRVNAPENEITWYITRKDEHGIKKIIYDIDKNFMK